MKVIMNPPYCDTLHTQILREALNHSDDIVNLSPIRWLQDPLRTELRSDFKRFHDVVEHIADMDVISCVDASNYFGASFFADLGIYKLTKDGGFDTEKIVYKDKTSAFEKTVVRCVRKEIDNIENHIGGAPTPYHVNCSRIHGNPGRHTMCDLITPQKDIVRERTDAAVYFNSEEEAENFRKSVQTKFYRYIVHFYKKGQNVYWQRIPWLGDYTKEWTNKRLYEYFGLTKEEQDYIDKYDIYKGLVKGSSYEEAR